MAKIIIDITRDFSDEKDGIKSECLGTKITVTELSPKEQSGPQDALANIIAHFMPGVIKTAGEQLATEMTKLGNSAYVEMYSRKMN